MTTATQVRHPWVVYTQRGNESVRRGFGQEQLHTVFKHLARRGDTRCRYFPEYVDGEPHPSLLSVNLRSWL